MKYCLKLSLHKKIKSLLKGSSFENLFECFLKYGKLRSVTHCRALMDALYKCFDQEDNTFNLGQTKIYFGLEDVLMIIGLPIDGEPVTRIYDITKEECRELIGITPDTSNRVSHGALVKIIENIKDTSSDGKVMQACRATALLGIACTIIQGIG
ncbi:serine/threonine-protein phosphatase 7 long form-like protein, partial [Trifolium medium]|nr:serine/threonine-protein phosphatase 7 long form-like protein [Trifolium medium]